MSDPMRANVSAFPGTRILMPRLRRLSEIKDERITWMSKGRMAEGKLTIMDGDPGLGKSSISLDWAARITRGEPLPDGPKNRPRSVIVLTAEDGLGDTVKPRFRSAGGDLDMIYVFEMVDQEDGTISFPSIPGDIEGLAQQVTATDTAMVIVDPLVAFLGSDVKANDDKDVRRALSPLTLMADQTRVAVLALRHLNKSVGTSSLYRGGGSIGIIGAARFGLLVAKDPEDETGKRRIVAVQKCNLAVEPASLAYHLESVPGTDVAKVVWDGESTLRAQRLTEGPRTESERAGAEEARLWLKDILMQGKIPSKILQRQAREDGISWRTVEEVKATVGALSGREGFGAGAVYYWWLPMSKPPPLDTT